jgi:hypothetical protein
MVKLIESLSAGVPRPLVEIAKARPHPEQASC